MGNVSEPRGSSKRISKLALSMRAAPAPRVHDNHLGLSRRAPHVMPLRVRFGADGEASYVRSWSGPPRHALRLCVSLALCRGGLGTGRRSRRPHSSAGASATVTGGEVARCEIWGDMARYGETWRRSLEEVARCVVVERLVDIRLRDELGHVGLAPAGRGQVLQKHDELGKVHRQQLLGPVREQGRAHVDMERGEALADVGRLDE
mmetsp:Transcript_14650/g.48720  ORF Transcript_14650/g.48720 Transcript_14650/m.48720 type:complete len:205 (+) Transcript_14650:270-884(+)